MNTTIVFLLGGLCGMCALAGLQAFCELVWRDVSRRGGMLPDEALRRAAR